MPLPGRSYSRSLIMHLLTHVIVAIRHSMAAGIGKAVPVPQKHDHPSRPQHHFPPHFRARY